MVVKSVVFLFCYASRGSLRRYFFLFTSKAISRRLGVAALFRCYSPSPHPLLSHVPALLPLTNHDRLCIRFFCMKFVHSTRLCSGGPRRLPGDLNGPLPAPQCACVRGLNFVPFRIPAPWDPTWLLLYKETSLWLNLRTLKLFLDSEYYNCDHIALSSRFTWSTHTESTRRN
jgi:hypothetical protein